MSLFISSVAEAIAPAVYAVDVAAPTVIEGISNGKIGYPAQFEWGPINTVYEPTSPGDVFDKYAPAGAARNSTGYYGIMRRKKLALAVVRVLATDSVKASITKAGTGGNITGTAKYEGALGNSIVMNIAASSDGNTSHRKLTFTLSDTTTGRTVEVYDNVAFGDAVDVTASKLLSALAVASAMTVWPANGNTNLTSGSNGTAVAASDYESGMDLLDAVTDVSVYVADDCGSSLRTQVNADLMAHVVAMTDRIAIVQGETTNALADAKTDVASYRSKYVRYCASWANVLDDGGTARLTPGATFMASALINLEPQQSDAWGDDRARTFYEGVDSLYTTYLNPGDPTTQDDCTIYGIGLLFRETDGKYAGLIDRNTNLAVAYRYLVTTRIAIFLCKSIATALRSKRNAPNVGSEQRDALMAVRNFLKGQKEAERVLDFSVSLTGNTALTAAQGQFLLPIAIQTPAPMERILLLAQIGPTVTVTVQDAA